MRLTTSGWCLAASLSAGCTVTRPVAVAPEPEALAAYLRAAHPKDLEVTDTAGRAVWLHNPELAGDTLAGVLSREEPRLRRGVPLGAIRTIGTPHFSAGRTLGLVGGVVGVAGVVLVIVAVEGPQPVY